MSAKNTAIEIYVKHSLELLIYYQFVSKSNHSPTLTSCGLKFNAGLHHS